MKLNFHRQAGATLIEVIMVVALIAIITIGALVYFNTAQDASRVQTAVGNVTALSSVIRNQYSTQGTYVGISAAVVTQFGGVPENMVLRNASGAPTHMTHPWNTASGAVAVDPATTVTANDSFEITLTSIPATICNDLVSKTYRHFLITKVGTTTVNDVASITTACGTTGERSVSFTQR